MMVKNVLLWTNHLEAGHFTHSGRGQNGFEELKEREDEPMEDPVFRASA